MLFQNQNVIAIIMNSIMLGLAIDAVYWAFTLHRHSEWMKRHPIREKIDCDRITHRMLSFASFIAGVHILLINLSWIYFKVQVGYNVIIFFLIAGVNVMFIHLMALLARCTDLDKEHWPLLSKIISRNIISPCRRFIDWF